MEVTVQVSIVYEALFDMGCCELDRSKNKLKPNGKKHFGKRPIIRLENIWYDFTRLPEKNGVKIETVNYETDREDMNRAKKICTNLLQWEKFFFITQQKHEAYEKKLKDELANQEEK